MESTRSTGRKRERLSSSQLKQGRPPPYEVHENVISRLIQRSKEGWGMIFFAILVFLYVLGFCTVSPSSQDKDIALPVAEAVRATTPKSYFIPETGHQEHINYMLPGAIKSSGRTFELDSKPQTRDSNTLPGAIGLSGSFDDNPEEVPNAKKILKEVKPGGSRNTEKEAPITKKDVGVHKTLEEKAKGLPLVGLKHSSETKAPSSISKQDMGTSTTQTKAKTKTPERDSERNAGVPVRRKKRTKKRRKKKSTAKASTGKGKSSAVLGSKARGPGGKADSETSPDSKEMPEKELYLGPHPMNRKMNELQVEEGTGPLEEPDIRQAYQKLVQAYLAPFSGGIKRRTFFEILRRKTYSLTPPGANKGGQTILFQLVGGKVFLLDPYEVRKNSKPFYRSRIKELVWLLSEIAKDGKVPDTEFLLAIHDCVQTVNKDHTYRGSVYKESNPTFTIVSCNFSDNVPFPMWEGDEVRGGLKSWDEKMEQYQKADTTPWSEKMEKAVFRGGNRASMYFKKKSDANEHCDAVGRSRLHYIAEQSPELFDVGVGGVCGGKTYSLSRLSEAEHHKYKYILYAEGNCFWADRLNKQVFGPSAVIKQETPCGQFWEPLMKPMTHYIPTDFFFQNTVDQVQWAKNNDEKVQAIVKNANEFAANFLSFKGIKTYVEVLLTEYTKLLESKVVKAEKGSEDVTV